MESKCQRTAVMHKRETFITIDGLNNIWQAKTPDLLLLFCSTGFHLKNMFPMTICNARAVPVSLTQHFLPWNMISIYPNSEPVSTFLSLFCSVSETDAAGFTITCWAFDSCQRPREHDDRREQRSCSYGADSWLKKGWRPPHLQDRKQRTRQMDATAHQSKYERNISDINIHESANLLLDRIKHEADSVWPVIRTSSTLKET